MSMGMEVGVFLAYAFGMLMVYIFGRFFMVPLKWAGFALLSSAAGGAVLLLINHFGAPWGVFIPVNMITSAAAGLLGIPGILLMAVFF